MRQETPSPYACEEGAGTVRLESAEPGIPFSIRELIKGLEIQLRQLADSIGANEQVALPLLSRSGAESEQTVRTVIRSRNQREKFFSNELFADPAWDMLLDLYLSEIIQQRVSVSSLCIASNVPNTTALRWITTLEDEGLIERNSDPLDKRRYFMSLTNKGRQALDDYFSSLLPAARSSTGR